MSQRVDVIIEPVRLPGVSAERLRKAAAAHPAAAAHFSGTGGEPDADRLRVGPAEPLGHDPTEEAPFRAAVFDPQANVAVELRGRLDALDNAEVVPSTLRPLPSAAELRAAAEILRADPGFPAASGVIVYRPMPPLADLELPDGTRRRRPVLGVYNPSGRPVHRFAAVDIAARKVAWDARGLHEPSDNDCEERLPRGVDSIEDQGGHAAVRVRVVRAGGEELWNLVVVRPRDSAPQWNGKGSGVELREVRYRGRLVLRQAHVPILNVLYDDGVSYRDWQNGETLFRAHGSDPVGNGWRLCDRPPETILEAGDDEGDFQGVALHHDGRELRIVSELEAGWYRYVSDWRLADNGVIRPRFGFAGVRNPRTCMRHHHHAYWRFDFDIGGAASDTVEQLGADGRWTTIVRETSRRRGPDVREWRVRDKVSGAGYRIVPGARDGRADEFGVADAWFLRHHPDELADRVDIVGGDPAETRIRIDPFVNGENIDGANLVVWYAGHFLHDENNPAAHTGGHIVGPDLIPL
ncbi:hypothetical protein GCM10010106_02200 [Thermopolyspora flexuosa]|jgi:hypothetical protein|uniref:Uncharacterized protein n=1 Tax=Thermopolyspora flexuosa TaxID=103836 RepID=A0A543IY68_9ACTN|nr:hypothetical protein [Thermopolyspora flexuosa]TQM75518.1 hypothetical protein FHX40_2228 [Thermopolyspora flexuosa]GGM60035.1 hypothetical protein GCM10010106_02200 [Thermopolyspora flexuosa]